MTCESFDARLDALLEGRCAADEWAECEAHLAACARCRGLFDAMSGRAGDLDDEGHEALAAAVVAKTSGSGRACASARERLCDFVDGTLDAFDRDLVQGHLERCAECSALSAAIAEQTRVLATFATLEPRHDLVPGVLAATSRRRREPTLAEKVAGWLAHAAERPRFSVEVAYVLTVLLLVVLGNPVDAFREASVRVQPRVAAVAGAVSKPLSEVRAVTTRAEALLKPAASTAPGSEPAPGLAARFAGWLTQWIVSPFESVLEQVTGWATRTYENLRRAFAPPPTEPGGRPAR